MNFFNSRLCYDCLEYKFNDCFPSGKYRKNVCSDCLEKLKEAKRKKQNIIQMEINTKMRMTRYKQKQQEKQEKAKERKLKKVELTLKFQ